MKRLKIPSEQNTAYYHCLSRVVDKRHVLGPTEKEHFVSLMRECERFCRVRVLTFAIMANHFHILLEVPQRPPAHALPGPEEIVADLKRLSGCQFPGAVEQQFKLLRESTHQDAFAEYLATFHARLFDVSAFMKLLKQRFTLWFNARSRRKGTLWEERFRSVLVDGAGEALTTMAAYIDLNPVRAGLVKDPKDYRWTGYAEAVAGNRRAQKGVQSIVEALQRGHASNLRESMATYRMHLFIAADPWREGTKEDGTPVRGTVSREQLVKVMERRGRLPLSEYLQCRVRYFCDGAVFGGRKFVEGIFKSHRRQFGPKRKTGARRLKGLANPELYALRDLRVKVFE